MSVMFYIVPFFFDEAEYYGPTYIQYCEYFQLDPRINYTVEEFKQRYESILNKFKVEPGLLTLKSLKEMQKGLKWIEKRKKKLPLIVNYTSKLLIQKVLIIPDGMIQADFSTKKGLTKEAVKPYNRSVLFGLLLIGIALIIVLVIAYFVFIQ